ncbi:hypothetical protein DFH06DRAFT_1465722 [Mycena polygramma]|nr:hypothetical protein DFH06DRAFT_1465722 [Mycena polygramma]
MSSTAIPLKFPRLLTLFLAWAWSLISLAIGMNKRLRPANDVFAAGGVVTVISALILLLSTLYLALLLLDHRRGRTTQPSSTSPFSTRPSISTRTLTVQYATLGFLAVWLFATQIPVSMFVAQRSARVSASINGVPLPGNVNTAERVKTRDSDFGYGACLFPVSLLLSNCYGCLGGPPLLATLATAVVAFLAATTPHPSARIRRRIGMSRCLRSPSLLREVGCGQLGAAFFLIGGLSTTNADASLVERKRRVVNRTSIDSAPRAEWARAGSCAVIDCSIHSLIMSGIA